MAAAAAGDAILDSIKPLPSSSAPSSCCNVSSSSSRPPAHFCNQSLMHLFSLASQCLMNSFPCELVSPTSLHFWLLLLRFLLLLSIVFAGSTSSSAKTWSELCVSWIKRGSIALYQSQANVSFSRYFFFLIEIHQQACICSSAVYLYV